jgi:putative endonuclease
MPDTVPESQAYLVYIVQCADGSLYTGSTTNVQRRVAEHNAGKGARYTRSHRPVTLLVCWSFPTKGDALRAERMIKQLPRSHKLWLLDPACAPHPKVFTLLQSAQLIFHQHLENQRPLTSGTPPSLLPPDVICDEDFPLKMKSER